MAKAGIVYAATDDGLVILSDPASIGRWRRVGHVLAGQALFAVEAASALALVVAGPGGAWRSDDGGQTWAAAQPIAAPTTLQATLVGQVPVILAATDSGLVRSIDGGASWVPTTLDEPLAAPITALTPAAYHIDTAWAGSADGHLLLSTNRGRSWATIARGLAAVRAVAAVRLA